MIQKGRRGNVLQVALHKINILHKASPDSFLLLIFLCFNCHWDSWQYKRQWAQKETWEVLFEEKETLFFCDADRLYREVVESSSSEVFKSHLELDPDSLLYVVLLEPEGLTR